MGRPAVYSLFGVLVAGCGYSSHYPEAVGRDGAPLTADSGGPAPAAECSEAAPSSVTTVTFINAAPVDLRIVDADCVERPLAQLAAAYEGLVVDLDAGAVVAVYSVNGALFGVVRVPDTGGGAWSVEVP